MKHRILAGCLLIGACQAPQRVELPAGAFDDAKSAILEVAKPGGAVETRTIDVSEGDDLFWSQVDDPDLGAKISIYGCSTEDLKFPLAPDPSTRACLPVTNRRLELDLGSSAWLDDPGASLLPACSRCEQFPLRAVEHVSSRAFTEKLLITAAVMLDETTVLLLAEQDDSAGVTIGRSAWLVQRGATPPFTKLDLVPDFPGTGPDITDLAIVGDTILGVASQKLYRIRLGGGRLELTPEAAQPEPIEDVGGDCRLLAGRTADDLYLASGFGALFRRTGARWQQLAPPRIKASPDERVDLAADLALFGSEGVIAAGVTTSTTDYSPRPDASPIVYTYYIHDGQVGRVGMLPYHEGVAGVATLEGRSYVMGARGGLVELSSEGRTATPLREPTTSPLSLVRSAGDRLILAGRTGDVAQVVPKEGLFCPPEPELAAEDILFSGHTVAYVAHDGLELTWYEVVPLKSCGLESR